MTMRELSNAISNSIGDVPYDSEVISLGADSEGHLVVTAMDAKHEYKIRVTERGRLKGKFTVTKETI